MVSLSTRSGSDPLRVAWTAYQDGGGGRSVQGIRDETGASLCTGQHPARQDPLPAPINSTYTASHSTAPADSTHTHIHTCSHLYRVQRLLLQPQQLLAQLGGALDQADTAAAALQLRRKNQPSGGGGAKGFSGGRATEV